MTCRFWSRLGLRPFKVVHHVDLGSFMRGADGIGCRISLCGSWSSVEVVYVMLWSHGLHLIAAWEPAGRNRWRFRREGSRLCCFLHTEFRCRKCLPCCLDSKPSSAEHSMSELWDPLCQEGDATEPKEVRNTACVSYCCP